MKKVTFATAFLLTAAFASGLAIQDGLGTVQDTKTDGMFVWNGSDLVLDPNHKTLKLDEINEKERLEEIKKIVETGPVIGKNFYDLPTVEEYLSQNLAISSKPDESADTNQTRETVETADPDVGKDFEDLPTADEYQTKHEAIPAKNGKTDESPEKKATEESINSVGSDAAAKKYPVDLVHKRHGDRKSSKSYRGRDFSDYEDQFFNELDYDDYENGRGHRKSGKTTKRPKTTPKRSKTTPESSRVHSEELKTTTVTSREATTRSTFKSNGESCKNASLVDKCVFTGGDLSKKDMMSSDDEFLKSSPCKVWYKIRSCLDEEAKCPKMVIENEKKEFEREHQVICSSAVALFCSSFFIWHAIFWLNIFG